MSVRCAMCCDSRGFAMPILADVAPCFSPPQKSALFKPKELMEMRLSERTVKAWTKKVKDSVVRENMVNGDVDSKIGSFDEDLSANEKLSNALVERMKDKGIAVQIDNGAGFELSVKMATSNYIKNPDQLEKPEMMVKPFGKEKPYNNKKKATPKERKGILAKVKEKKYTFAGTDAILENGKIFLIDHSSDKILEDNLKDGDGYGIRDSFKLENITDDDIRRILRNIASDYGNSETRLRERLQNLGIRPEQLRSIDIAAELKTLNGFNGGVDATRGGQGQQTEYNGGSTNGGKNQESGNNATELMTTSDGTVYGFTHNGKIYINGDHINPNTLIHEFTHLWCKIVKERNPKLWGNIKQLLHNDKLALALGKELKDNATYKDLDSDAMVSEIIARFSGKNGRARLEKIQKELNGETLT